MDSRFFNLPFGKSQIPSLFIKRYFSFWLFTIPPAASIRINNLLNISHASAKFSPVFIDSLVQFVSL